MTWEAQHEILEQEWEKVLMLNLLVIRKAIAGPYLSAESHAAHLCVDLGQGAMCLSTTKYCS